MRTIDVIQGNSNRNQALRFLMLLIIAGTFPFYCLGVIIIGSAPAADAQPTTTPSEASNATFTPLGADQLAWSTVTALPALNASITPLGSLLPTPRQFIPPTSVPTDNIVAQTVVSPSPTLAEASPTERPTATAGPADRDSDGVFDSVDACPEDYGYSDNQGCPYPDDQDRDGVRSDADRCPEEYAPDNPRGCRDKDDDGLDTSQDQCPDQAGPSSNQGCPITDAVAGG